MTDDRIIRIPTEAKEPLFNLLKHTNAFIITVEKEITHEYDYLIQTKIFRESDRRDAIEYALGYDPDWIIEEV